MATITGQQVVNRGIGYSSTNDPGVTITPNEGLTVLRSHLRVLYNRATSLNPFFSGVYEDVEPVGGKWDRPAGALRVFHTEVLRDGRYVEVANLSVRDRYDAEDPPRIYRLGLCYYSVGEDGDPDNVSESIRFYYSDDSPGIAGLNNCLPEWFQDEHEELLVVMFARYVALKDKARGDMGALNGLLNGNPEDPKDDGLLGEFDRSVLEFDMNVAGRFGRHAGQGLQRQGFAG